jgi:hypothetical protein
MERSTDPRQFAIAGVTAPSGISRSLLVMSRPLQVAPAPLSLAQRCGAPPLPVDYPPPRKAGVAQRGLPASKPRSACRKSGRDAMKQLRRNCYKTLQDPTIFPLFSPIFPKSLHPVSHLAPISKPLSPETLLITLGSRLLNLMAASCTSSHLSAQPGQHT